MHILCIDTLDEVNYIFDTMSIWIPDLEKYSGHRYRALAEAIRDAINVGTLKTDDKLPPHRDMAWRLSVTVGTVAKAYKLAAEWGLVTSQVGHGTRIAKQSQTESRLNIGESKDEIIDFGLALPAPLDSIRLRTKAFKDPLVQLGDNLVNDTLSGFAPELGYKRHRISGAQWIARAGMPTSEDEVMVTHGAQEAMHLILSIMTNPSDTALGAEFGYLGFRNACTIRNLHLDHIELDQDGIIPASVAEKVKKTQAKILFVSPNLQNPTGVTLSLERRKEIARLSEELDFYIIESDAFFALLPNSLPPIASFAPDRTFLITSLTKYCTPSLRVAFMRSPSSMVPELIRAKRALALAGSSMQAEVAHIWVSENIIDEIVDWQISEIQARWKIAKDILGNFYDFDQPPKPFIWLELPEPWRATDFVSAARSQNITTVNANQFMMGRGKTIPNIRIALTTPKTRDQVKHGLQAIKDLMLTNPGLSSLAY